MAAVETAEVHDPHYEPIISLPEQVIPTLEEDEDVLFKMRAKLFRWARESDPPEWKERGTGDVKLLKHRENLKIRLVMRRDKTFKTCANHYLDTNMELVPNSGSERAWVWTTFADFAEGEAKEELLAIRFLNSENANKFKEKFCECQQMLKLLNETNPEKKTATENEEESKESEESSTKETNSEDTEKTVEITKKLEELNVESSESDQPTTSEEKKDNKEPEKQPKSNVEDSPEK